jgi:predicted nuclease of predicted toxin-antitoxin system
MWEKTELSKKEEEENLTYWKSFLQKKAKFLLDEHLDPVFVSELKGGGYHAIHVEEVGLIGMPDENIYNYAKKKDLIIITANTKHFWPNSKKIPLKNSPGIICLECNPGDFDKIIFLLANVCYYFGNSAKGLIGTKIKVNEKEILMQVSASTKIEFMKVDIKSGEFYSKV